MLGDLKDARWIIAKGLMFLLAGSMASGLLLLDRPTLRAIILHGLAVWCFCRFYYFAFYVIEHYIDPTFKYAGLWSAMVYLMSRKAKSDCTVSGMALATGSPNRTPNRAGG